MDVAGVPPLLSVSHRPRSTYLLCPHTTVVAAPRSPITRHGHLRQIFSWWCLAPELGPCNQGDPPSATVLPIPLPAPPAPFLCRDQTMRRPRPLGVYPGLCSWRVRAAARGPVGPPWRLGTGSGEAGQGGRPPERGRCPPPCWWVFAPGRAAAAAADSQRGQHVGLRPDHTRLGPAAPHAGCRGGLRVRGGGVAAARSRHEELRVVAWRIPNRPPRWAPAGCSWARPPSSLSLGGVSRAGVPRLGQSIPAQGERQHTRGFDGGSRPGAQRAAQRQSACAWPFPPGCLGWGLVSTPQLLQGGGGAGTRAALKRWRCFAARDAVGALAERCPTRPTAAAAVVVVIPPPFLNLGIAVPSPFRPRLCTPPTERDNATAALCVPPGTRTRASVRPAYAWGGPLPASSRWRWSPLRVGCSPPSSSFRVLFAPCVPLRVPAPRCCLVRGVLPLRGS